MLQHVTQAGESADRCCHGMPSGYNGPRPLHWPLLALHMLACAHPGMQRTGDAVTSILPAGIRLGRESASLVRAVKSRPQGNPTPGRRRALSCPRWSCTSFRWASEGRYRPYPPSDQRVRHRRRGWPSCTAMSILPLKRCTDSAPAPPGASGAFLGLSGLEREYGFRWAL